jgi:hypothetical protein
MDKKISLRKQAELAPKYVLHIESLGYLADQQHLMGVVFTTELELARKFSVGFDDPQQKIEIWSATLKRQMKTDVKFEAISI